MDPADAGMDNPPEPAPVASPAVGDEPVAWRARYGDEVVREWCHEEASRLAALAAEATASALQQRVEELTDEVARLRPIAKAAVDLRLDAGRERAATAAAEARGRGLREALAEIASFQTSAGSTVRVMVKIARAALSAHKEGGDA